MNEIKTAEQRWEEGIPHHPKSIAIYKAISHADFEHGDDYFGWRAGGDGDNGERLMYTLDIAIEQGMFPDPYQSEDEDVPLEFFDGKYLVKFDEATSILSATRYGEEWIPNWEYGGSAVLALLQENAQLKNIIAKIKWNQGADEHNQWKALGSDEKLNLRSEVAFINQSIMRGLNVPLVYDGNVARGPLRGLKARDAYTRPVGHIFAAESSVEEKLKAHIDDLRTDRANYQAQVYEDAKLITAHLSKIDELTRGLDELRKLFVAEMNNGSH
jgi:hypothetical protein